MEINFDALLLQDNSGSFGIICRDSNEHVLHVATATKRASSPLLSKAMALRFACSEATRMSYYSIHLEGDNSVVIEAILGKGSGSWEIDIVVCHIRASFSNFQNVQIGFVFREANAAVDMVARLGHLMSSSGVLHHPSFRDIVRKDALCGSLSYP